MSVTEIAQTGHSRGTRRLHSLAAALAVLLTFFYTHHAVLAQEASQPAPSATAPPATQQDFGRLFDAVVERISQSFWDQKRLREIGWQSRAAQVRASVAAAPDLNEAAHRINALLAELHTSHTGLLTADDVDYYVLLDVFSGNDSFKRLIAQRFRTGVHYAGIGIFSARIEDRDFVDMVLEGSPADRAGIKVGDEIVSADGAPYHPVRSLRGRIGQEVELAIRRTRDGPVETVRVDVIRIAPVRAFSHATVASARVIERGGRRIGYLHVWASVGDPSLQALKEGLGKLHVRRGVARSSRDDDEQTAGEAELAPIDALIIDMRGKIGGTGGNAGRYLDLLDPRGPRVRSRNEGDQSRQRRISLRQRTAVLIDHHTRSTAELFVHAYKRERQGPLIGTRTEGAVSAAGAFPMPGGNLLYLAVTGLEIDGEILEGPGVPPDIEVVRSLPYAGGADPVLEAAIEQWARYGGQPGRANRAEERTTP